MKIFATVGTHPQSFDRLFRELNVLKAKGLEDEIVAQIGNTEFKPTKFEFKEFMDEDEYRKHFSNADIIITHGGAGTIIKALKENKALIIVPRLVKFNEHTNDHQLDLAIALEKEGKALAVDRIEELKDAIKEARNFKQEANPTKDALVAELKRIISETG